jgi:uncharacterized membrane protein
MDLPPSELPAHVEETIRATDKLHTDHHGSATRVHVVVERTVDLLGRPGFTGLLLAAVVCWTGGNLAMLALGHRAIDPPPFAWMQLGVSLTALCITALILTTQRRDDQLAQRRAQMTFELAMLSEQKLAKIIQLLEESRRDNPLLDDRVDASADAMAMPADPLALGRSGKHGRADPR